jgi:hypothetical protein
MFLFNRSSSRWVRSGEAASYTIVLARTTIMARTISSSATSGPTPERAPLRNVFS